MRRKKSFRSTSFKFTDTGSPVYFGPEAAMWGFIFCSAAKFTAGSTAGAAGDAPALGAACACMEPLATGSKLPSGRSTNFEAAPAAFTAGSSAFSFFGAYSGLSTTKS